MKRIYFSGLILLFAIVAKAQQAPKPPAPPSIEERMKVVMDSMKVNMNLNEKQSAAIYEAFKNFFYDADPTKKPEPPLPPPPPPPPGTIVKAALEKPQIPGPPPPPPTKM